MIQLGACSCLVAVLITALPRGAHAQEPVKVARATRIEGAAPRIDGSLDDAAWVRAQVISDFLQKIPNEGAIPA